MIITNLVDQTGFTTIDLVWLACKQGPRMIEEQCHALHTKHTKHTKHFLDS